ncbi:MAG: hypothetical protein M3Y64_09205 [Gemmatimonadota bacterium]|nr:hypothetical protein [Gemmatimonadota bacterium]
MNLGTLRALSVLFGVVPFVFGLFRLITTGTDSRYIWLAFAALIGATLVMRLGKAQRRSRSVIAGLFLFALIVSILLAALAGRVLGATSGIAVLAVAIGFGLCSSVSAVLWVQTHRKKLVATVLPQ